MYLKDVKTEHLSAFQETYLARSPTKGSHDRLTGSAAHEPTRQTEEPGIRENVFRRVRELRWIPENPAELLLFVKTPKIEVKKKTPEEKQKLLETIPHLFPDIAQAVAAFVLVQRYSGLRLVEVVTLRTDSLREDGLMIMSQDMSQEKNEQPVFVPLPGHIVCAQYVREERL